MRNLTKFYQLSLVFLAVVFMYSCQQDEVDIAEKNGVEFILTGDMINNNSSQRADPDLPTVGEGQCDMALAAYAILEISGAEYKVDLKQWGNDFKTNLIELDPGSYTVNSLQLYNADDNAMFATPMEGSEFEKFVDQSLPVDFEVEEYRKIEYEIEVLCIENFTPPQFGFTFWNIDLKSVKNLCIFANYCDDEGHQVATMEAWVYPSSEETDETDLIWNASADGDWNSEVDDNELLCLKFPFDPEMDPADQNFYVLLSINGALYAGNINIDMIDEINANYDYLHLNSDCEGDFDIFEPTEGSGGNDGDDDGDEEGDGDEDDVTTTFDDGDDNGWLVSGDAQAGSVQPTVVNSGGNPGGYLEATDDVQGGVWYWEAPSSYNGDFYGGILSFDLKQSSTNSQFDSNDVIIDGGGLRLALDLANNPGTDWTSYSVSLDDSADWRIGNINGAAASQEQIETVLEDITKLFIRGEYRSGPDTGGLDNPTISEN